MAKSAHIMPLLTEIGVHYAKGSLWCHLALLSYRPFFAHLWHSSYLCSLSCISDTETWCYSFLFPKTNFLSISIFPSHSYTTLSDWLQSQKPRKVRNRGQLMAMYDIKIEHCFISSYYPFYCEAPLISKGAYYNPSSQKSSPLQMKKDGSLKLYSEVICVSILMPRWTLMKGDRKESRTKGPTRDA